MSHANINDPASIERIYPRAVFMREANANIRAKTSVLHGLRILSPPDAAGDFELVRAARHAGESDQGAGAVFLCPFARAASDSAVPAAATREADPYDDFIARVLDTARTAHLPEPTGRGDPRLKGLRQ
jgi:hypothetical protein